MQREVREIVSFSIFEGPDTYFYLYYNVVQKKEAYYDNFCTIKQRGLATD